ncbi:MAG: DNA primase [Christensenellales bacterium]
MTRSTFTDWLEELKYKTDIHNIVSRYLPLKQKGRNMWGLCPFHHEKTPSFSVNTDGQFYHCFGCGASGDVIKFVMEVEGLDFMDAVKMLASLAGMQLPENTYQEKSFSDKELKDKLLRLLKDAANHYHTNLWLTAAKAANEYLMKRGLNDETVKKFGLGLSVDFNEIIVYLEGKGYTREMMYSCGLVDKKDGRYYDALGARLIFPICDAQGQVVAFGGRLLEEKDFAKYKNTRETSLFVKNRTLYGLHLVKKQKLVKKIDSIIIVEGYMDAISLYSAGYNNVVASMGTSLTKEQSRLIKRHADKVYIAYDGDNAGQNATIRGMDILNDEGLEVKVVTLPDGMDPDDAVKSLGKEGFDALLNEAPSLTEYKLKLLSAGFDLNSYEGRQRYANEAIAVLKKSLDNNIQIEAYLESINKLTKISIDTLKFYLKRQENEEKEPEIHIKVKGTAYEIAEKYILHSLLYHKLSDVKDPNKLFTSDIAKKILAYITDNEAKGIKVLPASVLNLVGEDEKDTALEIIDFPNPPSKDEEIKYLNDCLKLLRNEYLSKKSKQLSREYDETDDEGKKKELLHKLNEIKLMIREQGGS